MIIRQSGRCARSMSNRYRRIHFFQSHTHEMTSWSGGVDQLHLHSQTTAAQARVDCRTQEPAMRTARIREIPAQRRICIGGAFESGKRRQWLQPRTADTYRNGVSSSNAILRAGSTFQTRRILRRGDRNSTISPRRRLQTSDRD